GGSDEAVGDEGEGAVGEGDTFCPAEVLVEDSPETELVGEGAEDEDGSPGGGGGEVGIGSRGGDVERVAGEEAAEFGEDFDEEVLATEIGDDALLDLTVFPIGFDDADVFVDGTAGGADFDGPGKHGWLLVPEVEWRSGDARESLS